MRLRERMGLKPEESSADKVLFQTVQPAAKDAKKRNGKRRDDDSDDEDKKKKKAWADDDDKPLASRKNKKKTTEVPAGSWQPFVAWVPNGAALGNPEPWKPLTSQEMMLVHGNASPSSQGANGKGRKPTKTAAKSSEEMRALNVVPGQAEATEKDKTNEDSDDDSGSGSDENQDRFFLLPIWEPTKTQKKNMNRTSGMGDTESSMPFQDEDDDVVANQPFFIINPDSNQRIIWDMASLIMVVYDCIMIPMLTFDMADNDFLLFMDWTTRLFWTTDMGWSCVTGYVLSDGKVEYSLNAILKRYAKTWLPLDLFIVVSDWATLGMASGEMGLSRLGRIFRIARAVRLLRLVRMQEIIANITERIQSDKIGLVIQISKHFLPVMFICHIVACGWWGIGVVNGLENQDSWVGVQDHATGKVYSNSDLGEKYLVSLHWALTQLSGGMDEVAPINTLERFYAVVMGVICFMVAVVMLSTLTSSLTQQYIIGGSGARQMANLRKYLKQNHCPKNLTKRVCRNAKHAISGDLTPDAVELLNVISEPLKIEMHYEMYTRILMHHPFFLDLLQGSQNQLVRWICHRAMSMLLLAHGDVVFTRGEEPSDPKMYFVASGELEYLDGYGEVTKVVEKQHLAEAALWTTWRHRGTLTAVNDVKMSLLDAQSFQDICKRYFRKSKDSAFSIKKYAADFLEELNANTQMRSDLDD